MSQFLTVIFLVATLTFHTPSEASHEKNHLSAVVVGTVYCNTCFQEDFSHTSHFISGASVGVECKDGSSTEQSFKAQVKTNSHGQFKVLLPFSVSKHVKKIEGCSVKLISSSEPYCAVASSATSSSLHLKARKQGTHIFSAGFFTFKPLKQPTLCNHKPSIQNSKKSNSQKFSFPRTDELEFPSPSQVDPTIPDLPPVPRIPYLPPLPQLPPLPPIPIGVPGLPGLPGIPGSPPVAVKTSSVSSNSKTSKNEQLGDNKEVAHPDAIFPPLFPPIIPNPFQPPPLIPNPFQPPPLIPNPLQPPPLIPNPFQPPPAPLIPNLPPLPGSPPAGPAPLIPNLPIPNLPPIPGLTPSPSPPPPILPFLPPLPFPLPPVPRIPGIPPAASSKQSSSP
ncbi:hypothetical protein FF1_023739 [Malus domestica]|uniref:uncharacterized protein LOC126610343 n=1 Tax=Malus sylvestris TaxID=3752 RepID=UPI0021ABA047|nr:uncharacterized protein LOC126610343 [Malus sylvestris]